MNNATRQNLIVVMFMAAALVVGTLATAAITIQSAFAYHQQQKKNKGSQDNSRNNSNNGNTVTTEECKNSGSASGFDTAVGQECGNLICTHPGNNAICTQERAVAVTPSTTSTPTLTQVNGQEKDATFVHKIQKVSLHL